jgi:hypothetical protein
VCYPCRPVRPVRYWLIDLPASLADVGLAWYRLYLAVVLLIAGPVLLLTVLTTLVLWMGFGIRWGW